MLVKGHDLDQQTLWAALAQVNTMYDGNIQFNRGPDFDGRARNGDKKYQVTLRVRYSQYPGHRLSFEHTTRNGNTTQHTMVAACWHVHRAFLDALAQLQPQVEVVSAFGTWTRDLPHHDPMVGSRARPQYASELCECGT